LKPLLRTRKELDLTDQRGVREFFDRERPQQVYLAAAKVGGILANDTRPAEFIHENIVIQSNIIDAAYRSGTQKLLFLGSSCIYPKHAPQPMPEDCLLTGPLEPTNEWYAIAKIAGLKTCQAYRKQYGFDAICAMPTNLYGPGDNFDLQNSHVLPALIRKFHEARANGDHEVVMWGTGTPRREFLHVDDMAAATVFLTETYEGEDIVNVGVGDDISIRELADMVREVVYPQAELQFDATKPDGSPRKLLDMSRLHGLGWRHKIELEQGIRQTYGWFAHESKAAALVAGG
jgi:GDP-L-fucose synthase